ncbi:MAG: hydantoinase/oxoprolinase family protein, partial [Gammaproteobacteria bacterium]
MITYLGIDTGGTFTDFVALDGRGLRVHKELSTPEAPERAILAGIAALGLQPDRAGAPLVIVHGSTVATNAVLEGKGARTAFVTNRGFADLLTIGRQARAELYELQPVSTPPPVPAELCLETGGRLDARGEILDPLTEADLEALLAQLRTLAPAAVAVTLLFSFLDPAHERRIAARLAAALPEVFVCCSAEVLPEIREFERGIATWLNAYVGPLMQGYLARLERAVAPARLSVMQSAGLACAPGWAGRHAVNLLLSGPAGGVQGARRIADELGCKRVLTFDMGGTSTDVAFVDGEPVLTAEGRVGPWPVGVGMIDLHTIGAGGGSLARLDEGGLLRVGPESAGARPGPACYGLGGRLPTVTDAQLLLGRLPASARLAGRMGLDAGAAARAYAPLAAALGIPVEAVAQGVVDLANEHMHQALRVMSVARGRDPRAAILLSFGGAGGLHVCELAEGLGMREALVPAAAGVLSALGMLAVGPGRQCVASLRVRLDRITASTLAARHAALEAA